MEEGVRAEALLAKAKSLPEGQQRRVAAILGAIVADAAAQPIHWVYNEDIMAKVLAENGGIPEFVSPSANPYYTLPTGSQSSYGDQPIVMLESLVACRGFNAADSAKRMFQAFGPGSPYDSQGSSKYSKSMSDKSMYPIHGNWRNGLLRRFCELHSEGRTLDDLTEEDKNVDPDNIPRLVPLVALYAGKPEMLEQAENAAAQLQSNDASLAIVLAACRLIERFVLASRPAVVDSQTLQSLVESVVKDLKSPGRLNPQSLDLAVAGHLQAALGSCDLSVAEATRKFGKA